MNEDHPIWVWRQTLGARIRANDQKVVDPNMSTEERAKMADVLDGVQPSPARPPKMGRRRP